MKAFNKALALALVSLGIMTGNVSALIGIDTVLVGDAGNANSAGGYGAVSYNYVIGKYEVTLSQYCAFLNSVGAADTYSLYNVNMGVNANVAGIARSGVAGSYTYSVIGSGARPVTYVSWFDAARFVNWLQNGQPAGVQDASTTEQGVYTLNGAMSGVFTRPGNAYFGLPSENEWYKAAYYQPVGQGGPASSYWTYATRASTQPDSRPPNSSFQNSGNFFYNDLIGNGYNGGYAVNNSSVLPSGSATTDGGEYTLASAFYGTFDQNGNAAEWTDGIFGSSRVFRGGSWADNNLSAGSRSSNSPGAENATLGFRIIQIPEPGVIGLMWLGIGLLIWKSKRSR